VKTIRGLLVASAFVLASLAAGQSALASGTSWIPFLNKKTPTSTTSVKKKATPKSSGTGSKVKGKKPTGAKSPGTLKKLFSGSKSSSSKKTTTIKPKPKTAEDTKPTGIKALFVADTTPPPPPKSIKEWMELKQIKP
jgi:hypothetical protein